MKQSEIKELKKMQKKFDRKLRQYIVDDGKAFLTITKKSGEWNMYVSDKDKIYSHVCPVILDDIDHAIGYLTNFDFDVAMKAENQGEEYIDEVIAGEADLVLECALMTDMDIARANRQIKSGEYDDQIH